MLVKVLPAYAGMIPYKSTYTILLRSAPRVCGDDPISECGVVHTYQCSPRMRG